jgi:hypothetical protein
MKYHKAYAVGEYYIRLTNYKLVFIIGKSSRKFAAQGLSVFAMLIKMSPYSGILMFLCNMARLLRHIHVKTQ